MENKLQQLTQKLYDEGLEKGRAEAERLVAEAKTNAAKIVKEAEAQAAKILAEANTKAQDVEKNAMTEISLAGKQALSKIKAEISSMIIAKSTAPAVKAATTIIQKSVIVFSWHPNVCIIIPRNKSMMANSPQQCSIGKVIPKTFSFT